MDAKQPSTLPTVSSDTPMKPIEDELAKIINDINTPYVYLCLLEVAPEASLQDIKNYFYRIKAPIIRFAPQKDKRVYVVQVAKSSALRVA